MALETFDIDTAHSSVSFAVRHMVISKVPGRFTKWSGTVQFDSDDLTRSFVEVHIGAASIDTHEPDRDTHLRSADFLDVEHYPELVFVSKRIEAVEGAHFKVYGDLTIRDVTREVELDTEYAGRATDPWGNERIGLEAKTTLNRQDWGVTWNTVLETGGLLVGDKVEITLEVEAVKQAAAEKVA